MKGSPFTRPPRLTVLFDVLVVVGVLVFLALLMVIS